jgi:hypothetical protein
MKQAMPQRARMQSQCRKCRAAAAIESFSLLPQRAY